MRLIDCFIRLVAYTSYFLASVEKKETSVDEVRSEIERLIAEAENLRKEGSFSDEDFNLVKFAVCAWADEAILTSPWQHVDVWRTQQLQRTYFDTVNAGEEFFEKLNNIPPEKRDVLEAYCLALELGFKGRYFAVKDATTLGAVKDAAYKQMIEGTQFTSTAETKQLFPWAYMTQSGKRRRFNWKLLTALITMLFVAGPVGLYLGLDFVYTSVLQRLLAQVMAMVM